jgi:hypothetical protein
VLLPGHLGGPDASLELQQVDEPKVFECEESFADMDAGTGTYVNADGTLAVYCAHHFIREADGGRFTMRFQEFFSTGPIADAPVAAVEESRVQLFDQPNLVGEHLLLAGPHQARVNDLDTVLVRGKPFSKRISSLRCRLPDGFALVLYREPKCRGARPLVVGGGGGSLEIANLGDHDFNDLARSCAIVATRVASNMEDAQWVHA